MPTAPAPPTAAPIALAEYARRRDRLAKALNGSVGLVLAGDGSAPLVGKWRADRSFVYLTGIADEPGAAVLFDPLNPDPKRRIALFLKPLNPEIDRWDGLRPMVSLDLKRTTGFPSIFRTNYLSSFLTTALRRTKKAACLHPLAIYDAPVSPDLSLFRKVSERVPGVSIQDQSQTLGAMRMVKSPAELTLMRKAADVTAAGYAAAMAAIRPGSTETAVQHALEHTYAQHGAAGTAYNSIVGAGINSTVLHYSANTAPLNSGDLLVIDSGAEYNGYACDVTRTYPVSGKFTSDQRELYELVLASQTAAIKALRPGVHMVDVDAAARAVIDKAGHADAFMHGVGHSLGLDVHDLQPDGTLPEGSVVTIEPGVYFASTATGIRIEDDILVKRSGVENLTAMIPKSVRDVEAALAAARSAPGSRRK